MKVYYDKKNKKLLVFQKKADSIFWGDHWGENIVVEDVVNCRNRLVKYITLKFLKPKARVLEGGCGRGRNVYLLNTLGYDAYGVDFAGETVAQIKKILPKLKILRQDVRSLKFSDKFFDGYWSLGVIEHFRDGYSDILKEAARVIKDRGYLFVSFPYMSPIRKLKARLGYYEIFKDSFNSEEQKNFYQFILPLQDVIKAAEQVGFRLVSECPYDAVKGLKDEVVFIKPLLQKIYLQKNILAKALRFILRICFSKISSHMMLLIFKKEVIYEKTNL